MEIMFNAKTYNSEQVIEEAVKEIHKQAILSLYNTAKGTLELALLNLIIITEDYKTELFRFQKDNGHTEFITENEYGQGYAQVVSSQSIDDEEVYNILIDKTLAVALIGDDILLTMKESLNSEQYAELLNVRQMAINTICHEFAHVHEFSLNRDLEWLRNKKWGTDLPSFYLKLAMQCWSEYFACRTVSGTCYFKPEDCIELITTCREAEKMLQEKRSKYNRRLISLDNFVNDFHKYTTFLLKKIAYIHGNLYCFAESRERIVQSIKEDFEGVYAKNIWTDYGQAMNQLFEKHPMWKDETVFNDLISLIEKYFNQFEIYLHQENQGIYYDIPVRL